MPAGAIVVKENYMPDKKLAAITVMYKVAGYNPEVGNWFWAKYTPDGKVEAEGEGNSPSSVPPLRAWWIVDAWLSTPSEGRHHRRRINKIRRFERIHRKR